MKTFKQSGAALILAMVLCFASAVCFVLSQENKESGCAKYGLSDCQTQLNNWDYFGISLLVFALAIIVGLILFEKKNN
jgi:ABC-type Fe3+ transport system permease subunit